MSSADSQRAYATMRGQRWIPPDGGTIAVPENAAVTTVSPFRRTPKGVGFGPLELRARESARDETDPSAPVQLDAFRYREREPGFLDRLFQGSAFEGFLGAGLLASADVDESPLSRREVLVGAGILMGIVAAGSRPAIAEPAPTLTIAEWDLIENRHGLQLHIADVVADVLPPDVSYYLEVGGHDVRRFTTRDRNVVIPPGWTGEVELSTDSDRSLLDRLDATFTSDEIRYESLALDKPASDYNAGKRVVVTDDPVVVAPLHDTDRDGSDVIMQVGGVSIPHRLEDDSHPVGYYTVTQQGLVYRVGEGAPDESDVSVVVNPGRAAELWDDLSR